ncbi:hypothetical protein ABW20_dc0104338 [Dactylellina cionopaga]|nr:hypothetical protein ABW20_dc0104338 [Dactylellina cionopaga]
MYKITTDVCKSWFEEDEEEILGRLKRLDGYLSCAEVLRRRRGGMPFRFKKKRDKFGNRKKYVKQEETENIDFLGPGHIGFVRKVSHVIDLIHDNTDEKDQNPDEDTGGASDSDDCFFCTAKEAKKLAAMTSSVYLDDNSSEDEECDLDDAHSQKDSQKQDSENRESQEEDSGNGDLEHEGNDDDDENEDEDEDKNEDE